MGEEREEIGPEIRAETEGQERGRRELGKRSEGEMGEVVGHLRGMDERLQELSRQMDMLEELKRQAAGRWE